MCSKLPNHHIVSTVNKMSTYFLKMYQFINYYMLLHVTVQNTSSIDEKKIMKSYFCQYKSLYKSLHQSNQKFDFINFFQFN